MIECLGSPLGTTEIWASVSEQIREHPYSTDKAMVCLLLQLCALHVQLQSLYIPSLLKKSYTAQQEKVQSSQAESGT